MRAGADDRGFTIFELVVVLSLAAIVLTFATLSFTGYFHRSSARRAASLFAQDLAAARGYAIRSREAVVVRLYEGTLWYDVATQTTATPVARRRFDGSSADVDLSAVSLNTMGDSIVFTPRGLAQFTPQSGVLGVATFSSGSISYTVSFNGMGASKIDRT